MDSAADVISGIASGKIIHFLSISPQRICARPPDEAAAVGAPH
jgi:hypothetical protein